MSTRPLSFRKRPRTSARVEPPELFDRRIRRVRRDRVAPGIADHAFLREFMLEGIEDRLSLVRRTFVDVLEIGAAGRSIVVPGARITRCDASACLAHGGVQADEDRLPFADGAFDLIVSANVLDTVNDLPGALTLIRRALRPDGLFLGAFLGAGTLPLLRRALRVAEPGANRLHPQIDLRSAGDLLMRAGFALPVADLEGLTVRYRHLLDLFRDLRGMAATNLLHDRVPLSRESLALAAQAFSEGAAEDGRTDERFEAIFLTGWAPDPSQPRPARRGSAGASLSRALNDAGGSQ